MERAGTRISTFSTVVDAGVAVVVVFAAPQDLLSSTRIL